MLSTTASHVDLTALGRGGGVRGSDTRFGREFAVQSRPPEGAKVIFIAGNVGLVGESDFFEDRSERVRKVQEKKARAAEEEARSAAEKRGRRNAQSTQRKRARKLAQKNVNL